MTFDKKFIINTLKEDIGKGDITSSILIPKEKRAKAVIITKEEAVICGLEIAKQIFKYLYRNIKIKSLYKDGNKVKTNSRIIYLEGKARAILTGERVALNFLSHLSGIATKTNEFVNKIKPYKAKILDTRKTIPGLRALEKYAVRCGGAFNHRMGLWDMVLIKDNHKKVQQKNYNIKSLVEMAIKKVKNKKIEVEVENLTEFKQAQETKPDIIMLDNMPLSEIRKAVKIIRTKYAYSNTKLEVSGNITLKNVCKIAKTGVDFISIGSLTHSAKAIDIHLEII